jgi:hypothetical protein
VHTSSTGCDIYICADGIIDPPEKLSSHSRDFSWRDFAIALITLKEGSIDDEAIDQVKVSGLDGLRAECLKYAWASEDCENHGSYHELLNCILSLEEETIDYLENNYDLTIAGKDLEIFMELKNYIFDSSINDFLLLLKENQMLGDMDSTQKMINAGSIENASKAARGRERRLLAIEPYADKIRLLSEKYSNHRARNTYAPPSDRQIVITIGCLKLA